ncbi:MAG: hypothetical protein AAF206_12390 [Bacteroidota bacterium]
MSTELQTGLAIVDSLSTQKELALLIAAASQRLVELSQQEELVLTDGLKDRISAIEARHARGEGKTYSKEEFRKHLNDLMSK